ncbi:amino acid adenylation domain-containing protein [Nitrosomonas sp. Nm166]|uniref:amino acid adenylation domain-containing protein n=1 Tax=Nitrosomonas sp. Nm166 TaxID=1881054 RepID=UPI001C42F15D|nr:non-ribosomal peptide synthetase [Nitrosomonas sp. Nm166]
MNANGKVDRKQLPEPEFISADHYEVPQGEVEEMLAEIWREALGITQVGRNDNFFELGGDSILSLQIVTKARRAGWKITPRQLFERQTVAALAPLVKPVETIAKTSHDFNVSPDAPIGMLPIQLDFFAHDIPMRQHWNQAIFLESRQPLETQWLDQALKAIVQHHSALRFGYREQNGQWEQIAMQSVAQDVLWVRDAADAEQLLALCNAAQRSLNLQQGPLIRALLVNMADQSQRLLLVVHHLVIDGVSWRILVEDLETAYSQARNHETIILPETTTGYPVWTHRLQQYTHDYVDEFTYWQNLVDIPAALPCDFPQGVNNASHYTKITVKLNQIQTQALLKDAPAAYRTQVNDLLLTPLASALCQWTGHEKILVDLEGHGREDLYPDIDLSRTIGWFTSLFPVVLDPAGDLTRRIKHVKESLRQIPNKGLGYGLFKYYGTEAQRQILASLPKAQVVFNYLGQFDASFDEKTQWILASEPMGDLMDQNVRQLHELSINSLVYNGEFCLDIYYSEARYLKTTVQALADIFITELQSVIAHCMSGVRGITPSDFSLLQINQHELDNLPIPVGQLEDIYPLSPMQAGMLFHSMFDTDRDIYVNQWRADIDRLSVERFKTAWQSVIDRHDILRTGFVQEGKIPLQWVAKAVELPFMEYDWRDQTAHPPASYEHELDVLAQSEYASGINLKKPPLIRIAVVHLPNHRYHMIMTTHHLLLDGWSTSQMMGEVLRWYGGDAPATSGSRYRDFIAWLGERDQTASETYWKERLRYMEEPTRLASVISNPVQKPGYELYANPLESSFTDDLLRFAKRERITVNTLMQAAWALLLSHYTGQQVVTFGATVAGRPADLPGSDQILGLFINTLPVSIVLKPELAIGEWLRDLQAQNLASREHEHTPLYEIQRWAGQHRQGLFDTILVYENYPVDEAFKQNMPGGLVFSGIKAREATNYPMTVLITENDGFSLQYSYACENFSEATVNSIAMQVEQLLRTIISSATQCLGNITLLSIAQWQQLKDWGVNEKRYDNSEPVHRLIERQAVVRPDATALIFGDTELSYAQLNERANQLAHQLIALGVRPESRVGIAVERSIEMVVGLLATLKAGGAYVPLDPDYPRERLNHMVTDSAVELLLTQSHIRERIPQVASCQVVDLDTLDLSDWPQSNPDVNLHGEHLAYIIYTSGSTGKPKGAVNRHSALYNRLAWMQEAYPLNAGDTVLQKTPFSFDVSVWEFFWPLMYGARLAVANPGDHRDAARLIALIQQHHVTTLHFVPSMLRAFMADDGVAACTCLKQIICSGEALQLEMQEAVFEKLPNAKLHNLYGPTEAAIDVTHWTCRTEASNSIPIGRPIAATQTYILDPSLNPVPQGVSGELYLGGAGLARGYLNRSGLTAERFVADPFDENGGRLYRTGDLARWRPDGQIEYLGRLDHQVKIRGFRIELGEIETQLLLQPQIREAVVVAKDGPGGARLVAYASCHAGNTVDTSELREALAKPLPDYMIPTAIVVLENLPLNANGKVDRKLLPEPEFVSADHYEVPQGEVEEMLAAIWKEVLGINQVGRNDNFFELGGDSILSLQIVTKARQASCKITPRQLFERQTISALAQMAELVTEVAVEPSQPEHACLEDYLDASMLATLSFGNHQITDIFPLSPTQEGMLFHTLEAPGTGLYVNQISVEVEGLDAERLARAWQEMIVRHAVLRTGFLWRAGLARPLQIVFKQTDASVIHLDWREEDDLEEQIAAHADQELKREFDFLNPPLTRLSLIQTGENRHQLIWTRHHILLDGWGDSILISDWLRCYHGETLAQPGPGYGVYVRWLAKQTSQAAQHFWQTELSGIEGPALLSKAIAKTEKDETRSGFAQIYTYLSVEETRRLQAFAQQQHITMNTFVQAAWALLLQRYTGKQTVVFGATVAGRPPSLSRSDEILGLFINTIPIPVERCSDLTVSEYLTSLQETNARLRDYEHTSLADIQRWAGFPGQPLFDSIIVFENYPINAALRDTETYGLRFGEMEGKGLTGYAMDLQVVVGDTLEIEYAYGCNDFTDEFVLDLRSHMELLMREMMSDPQQMVGELGWLGKLELDQLFLLRGSTDSSAALSRSYQPVHHLIERNAVLQPDAIALLMGEQEICYAELNARANKLAHRLIQQGAGPEIRIGVAMERSLDIIVTLLAILKSGAAYVPLDIDYPADRLAFMITDSALSLLITQSKVLPKLKFDITVPTFLVDTAKFETESVLNPEISVHEHNLAYIIYTSGSTGLPKGVAVTHGPLAMHCRATARIYEMSPSSCELLFMSFSFDGAHERWLTALTVGAGLAVRDQELWTAEQTYDALHQYGITNAAFPPAYLGQVAEWAVPRHDPPPVELYVFGGEAMPKASYDLIRQTLRPRMLINGYGPTETVVTPLIWKTEASNSFDCAYAPIGRPVGERVVYILDVDMQPVPMGIVGELYIGGYGLARGYLGRAGLTAERFVADPFDDKGGRLYRTGDLVRWMSDGNIEYIGRADHQVKIRGFRIELGEIEARIREVAGVADAAVVVHESATGVQLIAYVVPAVEQSAQNMTTQLKQTLSKQLPEYMLPAYFVPLNVLPRLPSGKLDRKQLPEPNALPGDTYQEPSTPEARALANIWQEVLGVVRVGETDNFFALGGDSLSSLKVMARIRGLTDIKLDFKLRDLIQRPTIASLLGLDKQTATGASELLALNQPCGDGKIKPLFCIHAGLGTVFDYQPLARQLQGTRTVYGLPCRMLTDPAHQDTSLIQMAEDYCKIIQSMQPEGPYHLLGWSLGGALVAIMAAILEAKGQIVAFLGLIDPYIPGTELPQREDWRQDFLDFVSVVIPGVESDEAFNTSLSDDSALSKQEVIHLLQQLFETSRMKAATSTSADGQAQGYFEMGAEELAHTFMVARQLKALSLQASALSPLKTRAVCWWTTTRERNERLALGQQIKPAEIHSIEIDADHFDIVRAESLLAGIESLLMTDLTDRINDKESVKENL